MPLRFGRRASTQKFAVKFGDGKGIIRYFQSPYFALMRAYNESGKHPAYVKFKGTVIAVVQRGGTGV